MKKIPKMVTLLAALVLMTQVSVLASPVSNQLQIQQQQLEQNKNSLKEVKDKRQELELSIEKLDNQIEDYMIKIEEDKKNITSLENDIKSVEKEITEIEEDIKEKQEMLGKRLRAMYINGQSAYINVLLTSENFSDLISRIDAITKIINIDKKLVNDLNDKKSETELKKSSLNVKHNDLVALKRENEDKLAKLNSNIADQKKLIEEAKSMEKLYASKIDESQLLIDATIKQLNTIKSEISNANLSRGVGTSSATVSNNEIIAYASTFLGIPYLWGGTSPETGFDCSGFTQYVYAHFGIPLGRTTYDQIKDGYEVSKDQLQPGDLVLFGQDNVPTHIGIYVGNNTYIHAPRTGDVIKISSMNRPDYITARRVK